jgi:hypothetical protein
MLRTFVLGFGGVLILASIFVAATGIAAPALWLFTLGALTVIGTVFERVLYKPLKDRSPGPGWTDTGERFVDPETGKVVKVLYNAASGERQYAVLDDTRAAHRPVSPPT